MHFLRHAALSSAVFASAFALVLFACGDDDSAATGAPDSGGSSSSSSSGADTGASSSSSSSSGDGGGDADANAADPSFEIKSPEISVPSGEEASYCFYFHTPNAQDLAVKSWSSTQTADLVTHMAVVFTSSDDKPKDTVSTTDCGLYLGTSHDPVWVYSAWKAQAGFGFPADDGTGKPVGKPVKANQSGFMLIQVANKTAQAQKATATLAAKGYAAGTATTAAEPFVGVNNEISLMPGAMNAEKTETCSIPDATSKLTWLSVFSHKQSIHNVVKDGLTVIYDGTNYEDPGATTWTTAPFFTPISGKLTYACTYNNASIRTITSGPSRLLDENCIMLSYYFPAPKPRLCLNSTLVP